MAASDPSGPGASVASLGHREPEDDFFCLRFQVWYPSLDCALRTEFKTCSGCSNCDQGRFNHKRHAASVRSGCRSFLRLLAER